MIRSLTLLLITITVHTGVRAQTLQQWLRWGDAAMAASDHASACRYYEGALEAAPGRMAIQWALATAYRNDRQYERAAALYERINSKDHGRTHPDALRWLAEMQLCSGEAEEARATWERLRTKASDPIVRQRADHALLGLSLARRLKQRPDSVLLSPLPTPINGPNSAFAPRIGPDGALYFTALNATTTSDDVVIDTSNYGTRIYRTSEQNEAWTAPEEYLPNILRGDIANTAWSVDGRRAYFTHCSRPDSCTIMMAERADAHWNIRTIEGLGEGSVTQPCVVNWDDREMMLFVRSAPDQAGGTDIWQARLVDGRAVELQPVTGGVNTPGNERCPWFDVRRNELWFSSDHLPGLGGYDVFVARFENDVFSTPDNPGTPFNSPQNDLYPFIDAANGEGWLSSDRPTTGSNMDKQCCSRIYRWMPPEQSRIDSIASEHNGPTNAVQALIALRDQLPLHLYFHNDEPGPRSTARTTALTYSQTLGTYREQLNAYQRQSPDTAAFATFWNDHVIQGALDLQRLVEALFPVLEQGRSVVLEVRGHASPLALNDYNARLSERRIASLRNELAATLNGALLPYIADAASNGARLELRTLPFGEEEADHTVSDQLTDLSRSVYSVAAARERRIDVLGIDVAARAERTGSVLQLVKELGAIRQDQPQRITFRIPNTSDRPLKLLESDADCGCTTAVLPTGAIAPGSAVDLVIDFSGRAPQGPLGRKVRITTDGMPQQVELTITGTVVP